MAIICVLYQDVKIKTLDYAINLLKAIRHHSHYNIRLNDLTHVAFHMMVVIKVIYYNKSRLL